MRGPHSEGSETVSKPKDDIERDATLSPCGTYRYDLWRWWDGPWDRARVVNFLMLNPSTADASIDDPTIRRCIGFARSWGCTGLVVTNLYAYRATKPADLWKAVDPIGPENRRHLEWGAVVASIVVAAWGAHGSRDGRGDAVLGMLRRLGVTPLCLAMTRAGQPCHPLYLPADLNPRSFEDAAWAAAVGRPITMASE